jgi:hypothetical protein
LLKVFVIIMARMADENTLASSDLYPSLPPQFSDPLSASSGRSPLWFATVNTYFLSWDGMKVRFSRHDKAGTSVLARIVRHLLG